MTSTTNNGPGIMDIAAELRCMIYDYAFSPEEQLSKKPVDILTQRQQVPSGGTLRATCKFIYYESSTEYQKAKKQVTNRRNEVLDDLVQQYEANNVRSPGPPPLPPKHDLLQLARGLRTGPKATCKHACAKKDQANCYMCSDPRHQRCFECGQNLAVALWCKVNPLEAPELIIPESNGIGNALGQFVRSLLPMYPAKRDVHGNVVTSNPPWAFCWWQLELQVQWALDVRCQMRKRAICKFWAMFPKGEVAFTEGMVRQIEESDVSMPLFRQIQRTAIRGQIVWEAEFYRRAEKWAKACKTVRDWFPKLSLETVVRN